MNADLEITYQATVLAVSARHAKLILTQTRRSACGSCNQRSGCISSDHPSQDLLQYYTLKLSDSNIPLNIGDVIELAIPKKAFWMALFYAYLLPTLLAIFVMSLLSYLLPSTVAYRELWLAFGGILAVVGAILFTAVIDRRYPPHVVRKISTQ